MKLVAGKQYNIEWLDAFASASWTSLEELDKLLGIHSETVKQTLYFVKETKDFYAFTSGQPSEKKDVGFVDIHVIPRSWIKVTKVR